MIYLKCHIFEKAIIMLGILSLLYFIICFLTFNIIVNFSLFFALIGIIFIAVGVLKISLGEKNIIIKRAFKIFNISIILILSVFIFIEACIVYSANKTVKDKPDYIMILGAGIRGRNMLLIQLQRTEKALEFIKRNPNVKVIVSGGQGKGEDISEAESMKEYLIQHGVNSENILKEEKSENTMENMKYTAEILNKVDSRPNPKIAIVTSNYHVFRAKFLARRAGLNVEGIAAPVNNILLPNFSIRECFAIIKSFFMDK
ncbi:MAG: YdcF family protein [Clostridium sp.]|uniref:YdcF family protein n=1 Tax=Clostridium sp. TaxID=1506 RepID=UPI0039EA4AA9